MISGVAEVRQHEGIAQFALMLDGHEGGRCRRERRDSDSVQGTRQFADHLAHEPQGRLAVFLIPEEEPELHDRPHRMQAELELRHHSEVAAAAANGPEEIGVLVRTGPQDPAIGNDDLGGDQIVDGQPRLPAQPAHPSSEGQTTHAGMANEARWYGEPVRLGRRIEIRQQGPTLYPCRLGVRIDNDPVQRAQVDDQAVVAHRVAREAVCSAAHCDLKSGYPSCVQRGRNVLIGCTTNDDRRPPVDVGVPRLPRLVVARILVGDNRPVHRREKRSDTPINPGNHEILLHQGGIADESPSAQDLPQRSVGQGRSAGTR